MDHCNPLLKHISTHMHFITNGYNFVIDQLDLPKATCPFKRETVHFEVRRLWKKVSLFITQKLNLRSITIRRVTFSNCRLFYLRRHNRSRFSAISKKRHPRLKWNFNRLILLCIWTTVYDWVLMTKRTQSLKRAILSHL